MAGIVVIIITIIPFIPSIIEPCAANIFSVPSTAGRSPLAIRYPSSGLQRKPLLQLKALSVSNMNFLERLSHLSTSSLSLASGQATRLMGFLVVVQAVQRLKQKRNMLIRKVTQMIGRNTHVSILSSRIRSLIVDQLLFDYQTIMQQEDSLVPSNKYIILVDNRQEQRLLKIASHNRNFKLRKTPIPLSDLTLYAFYQELEVGNHKLTPYHPEQQEEQESPEQQMTGNNKEIYTISEPQKLNIEKIESMKKSMNCREIIKELKENNEQFSKRSEYSKQKYIRKKEKKYMFTVHAEPTTLETVHKYYFKSYARDVYFMRWDMLALLLLTAGPFQRVLVAQKTKGLVMGGMLLRGATQIVHACNIDKKIKNYSIVEELNIAEQQKKNISFQTWESLKSNQEPFNNFVVVGPYNFSQILTDVHEILSPGCIVTFFCQSMEPLVEVAKVMTDRQYLNVKLYDSWARQYQVLKNRTHPLMNMDSCSGFILSALKAGK